MGCLRSLDHFAQIALALGCGTGFGRMVDQAVEPVVGNEHERGERGGNDQEPPATGEA